MSELILPDNDNYWISHIQDNLYMGGCTRGMEVPHYIDHVVALDEYHQYEYHPDVTFTTFNLIDYPDPPDFDEIINIARIVIDRLEKGRTLVHCFAGQNRSGLICATVLALQGMQPQDAIDLLREKRFPEVLSNPAFEKFVLDL
jgi:protein-tyrosine phosphatase